MKRARLACALALAHVRVVTRYVCYAEDPTPLSAINPTLYSLFISQPHVQPDAASADKELVNPLAPRAAEYQEYHPDVERGSL